MDGRERWMESRASQTAVSRPPGLQERVGNLRQPILTKGVVELKPEAQVNIVVHALTVGGLPLVEYPQSMEG